MAPPPPASLPLSQRVMALAQTLQFAWFAGHVTLLFCTLRYSLSWITFNYYSTFAKLSYRTAFVAAASTYGIVVYKAYRAQLRSGKGGAGMQTLALNQDVQYLIVSLVWLFSKQVPLALLPFCVYSVFHVATYTRSNLLPTFQPTADGKPSGLADQIGEFVKAYYDLSMQVVASLEILLWFRLFGSAILFQKGSWILLGVYTVFLRIRHSQSNFVQATFSQGVARVDGIIANQSVPPAARNVWQQVKGGVRSAADATDINRYIRPAGAAPKKAQ